MWRKVKRSEAKMPILINVSDSSHPLPTYATLCTALVDKWTQLERHGVLRYTGVLPSLVGRPPEPVDALHCTRSMRPHVLLKQPVSWRRSNSLGEILPVGLATAGPKPCRPVKLATL